MTAWLTTRRFVICITNIPFASVDDKELHLWEEMESNEALLYLMDEKKMRKLRKESDKRMGSWWASLMEFSFFKCLGVGLVMCYRLMAILNMRCCVCVTYVKVVDKQGFCFGALDYLWQWWAWWGVLVRSFKEWMRDM